MTTHFCVAAHVIIHWWFLTTHLQVLLVFHNLWWAWQMSNHGAIYEQASKTLPWINFPWVDKSIKRFRTWRRALDRNVISADNAFLTKQQIFPLTCPQTKHHSFRLRKHFPNGMASNWKPRDAFCEEQAKGERIFWQVLTFKLVRGTKICAEISKEFGGMVSSVAISGMKNSFSKVFVNLKFSALILWNPKRSNSFSW